MSYKTKAFLLRTLSTFWAMGILCLGGLWEAGAFSLLRFLSFGFLFASCAYVCATLATVCDNTARKAKLLRKTKATKIPHKAQPVPRRAA